MYKHSLPIAYETRPTRSRSTLSRLISMLAVCIALAPLAADGVAICYAQWCEVMGKSIEVRTPAIDLMASVLQNARDSFAQSMGPAIKRVLDDPSIALSVSSLFIILAMAMLRR